MPRTVAIGKLCKVITYPSYTDAEKILEKCVHPSAWAEYGEGAHELCKDLLTQEFSQAAVIGAGIVINKMGGMQAMQGVFYCLQALLMYFVMNDDDKLGLDDREAEVAILDIEHHIQKDWNGIGQWQF